jgi:DNA-binding transcriptional LysR family regulator
MDKKQGGCVMYQDGNGMRLFVEVVESGSFSEAGRRFGLAPSSVSRQIGALEDRLGAPMFNRTTRHLSLTEAGEIYYQRVVRILQDIEEAEKAVTALGEVPKGVLRLSAPLTFGEMELSPALFAFMEAYPDIKLDINFTDSTLDLVSEGIDVAIRIGVLQDSSLRARLLCGNTRVLCGTPKLFETYGTPQRPQDLIGHPCLTYRFMPKGDVWRFRRKGDTKGAVQEVAVQSVLRANSVNVLKSAALQSIGWLLVPAWAVWVELEDGALKAALSDYEMTATALETNVYAVYPANRHLSPKVRAFIDFMAQWFKRPASLMQRISNF